MGLHCYTSRSEIFYSDRPVKLINMGPKLRVTELLEPARRLRLLPQIALRSEVCLSLSSMSPSNSFVTQVRNPFFFTHDGGSIHKARMWAHLDFRQLNALTEFLGKHQKGQK